MLNQVGKVAAQGAMASLFFGSCLSGRHAGKQVSLSRSRSRSLALSHSLSAVLLMFYYCFTSLLLPLNFTPALFLYYCCTSLLLLLLSLWSPCRQAGDAQGTAARAQDHLSGAPLSSILHVYACVYVRACVRERDRDRETRDYVNANTHTHFLSHTHTDNNGASRVDEAWAAPQSRTADAGGVGIRVPRGRKLHPRHRTIGLRLAQAGKLSKVRT